MMIRSFPICIAAVRSLVVVLGVAIAAAGCVTRSPLSDGYAGPDELPAGLLNRFSYESTAISPQEDALRARRSFAVREISIPFLSTVADGDGVDDDEIVFEYYDLDGDEVTPVIVLLPILNGNLRVSRYFARHFANSGWAALVVDRDSDLLRNGLERPEQEIRRNISAYMRVLDWITENPELDSGAIGVFGISFGGMDAVMLAALDDRVDAVVAAMAGGDLAYLVMNTSYRSVARRVQRMLREHDLSREGMEDHFEDLIDTDPLALAPYVDAEDVFLIMTRTDLIVPFEAQQALRRRLGRPETLYLPTGHRTSVIYFPLLRSSSYDFFARQFSER
jgi:pimeloyl-ACP methyl ester carboxylesterase